MAELREVVYRVRLADGSRPPALVFSLVPESPTLRVATLAANLDAHGNVWRLVQVQGTPRELADAEAAFRRHRAPALLEKRVVGRGRRLLLLWYKYSQDHERGPSLTRLAFRLLGPETVVTDRSTPDGLEVRVLAAAGRGLGTFLRKLEEAARRKHEFTLLYVGPPRLAEGAGLTPADEETLQAARAAGFFAVPRRGSMRGLARTLGCSPSAASARLRRAIAKLIDAHA